MNRLNRKTGDAAVLAGPNASSRLRSRCQLAPTNVKITKILAYLFLLGFSGVAFAQEVPHIPGQINFSNCFPEQSNGRAGHPGSLSGPAAANARSVVDSRNGAVHTPKGDLKVLVIFAGIEEDNIQPVPGQPNPIPHNTATDPFWPQIDAAHTKWGTAFPVNLAGKYGYTDNIPFNLANTDNSLSNFYYQMSKGQFRVTFGYFPDRVNVPYNATANSWDLYENAVLDSAIAKGGKYQGFTWNDYDKRTNRPSFTFDNSTSVPDGEIDYVLIVWRNTGNEFNRSTPSGGGPQTGLYGTVKTFTSNGKTYTFRDGHSGLSSIEGFSHGLFMHEFAHNLYNAPHYNGANGTKGNRLYGNYGWGMMNSGEHINQSANAWERWYNGWIELQTGTNQVNSDIQSAADLPANGEFTLRDFVKTGDAVRIKIPHTNQYLWLENHTGLTHWDNRNGWENSGHGVPFQPAPRGILAFIENAADRSTALDPWNPLQANGLKTISADGNYDFIPDGSGKDAYLSSSGSPYLYVTKNKLYNFNRTPNPSCGQTETSHIFLDDNGDQQINYTANHGNFATPQEGAPWMAVLNGNFVDGMFGPNIGFQAAGKKMGLSRNPMIIPHQTFDITANRLSPINLHGLSVEIILVANNGPNGSLSDITIKVRFDDTDITTTRWTGDLILPTNLSIKVKTANTLTINKSSTANRTTKINGAFVNPTVFTCKNGSTLDVEGGATVIIEGGTHFKMEAGSNVILRAGATFIVRGGSTLEISDNALFEILGNAALIVEENSLVIVRNTVTAKGLYPRNGSTVRVKDYSKITIESGATFEYLNQIISGKGIQLQDQLSEFNIKGTFATLTNVNFTFGGTGFMSFEGPGAKVKLAANSKMIQHGSGTSDLLYLIKPNTNVVIAPYEIDVQNGKIEYGSGSSLRVRKTTGTSTFNTLNFVQTFGNQGNTGLICQNMPSVTLNNCYFPSFASDGLKLDSVQTASISNSTFEGNGQSGIQSNFKNGKVYISNSSISNSTYGVYVSNLTGPTPTTPYLFLRNRTVIEGNDIGVFADTPAGASSNLVAGDLGCAWIINNHAGGVVGADIYLDIDALAHQGTACPKQTNRFDGNGGFIFDICYTRGVGGNVSAQGNYWGPNGLPDPAEYQLNEDCTGNPSPVNLDASQEVQCEPISCEACPNDPLCPSDPDGRMAGPTSTKPNNLLESFKVNLYPNPAQDYLTVEIESIETGNYSYQMVNAVGKEIRKGTITNKETSINVKDLPRGTYMIRVSDGKKTLKSAKVVTIK